MEHDAHTSRLYKEDFEALREVTYKVEAERDKLKAAALNIWRKYQAMPDGELGRGLTNSDFFQIRDALGKSEALK